MSFITQEKSELMAKFEKILEGVEDKFVTAVFCADIAIEHAATKVKNGFSNSFVTDSFPAEIKDEMDADMEDSGMAQGEIESCLTHWSNKYVIQRKGFSSNQIVIRSLSLPPVLKKELNDLIDKHNPNLTTEERNAIECLTEIVRCFGGNDR